jgi:hypothetical protein
MSTPPSRSFSRQRRSCACRSRSLDSASTAISTCCRVKRPSHARRSPGIGSGTSVSNGVLSGRSARNRLRIPSCPASTVAPAPGIARAVSCRPTAVHDRLSWSSVTCRRSARSIRPNCAWDIPTRAPASRWLMACKCRAARTSRPMSTRSRSEMAIASPSRLERVGTAGSWRQPLHCRLRGRPTQTRPGTDGAPTPRPPHPAATPSVDYLRSASVRTDGYQARRALPDGCASTARVRAEGAHAGIRGSHGREGWSGPRMGFRRSPVSGGPLAWRSIAVPGPADGTLGDPRALEQAAGSTQEAPSGRRP